MNLEPLAVNQVVHGGPYGGSYLVVGFREIGCGCFTIGADGLRPCRREARVLTEANDETTIPETILQALPYHPGEVLDAAGVAEFRAEAQAERERREFAESLQAAEDNEALAAALAAAEAAGLERAGKRTGAALAAANIRRELKAAFPGVKFSVRTRRYSHVDVMWTAGPRTAAVEAVALKFKVGNFDGMVDCYEYDRDRRFFETYGGAEYVFCTRSYPDALIESAAAVLGKTYRDQEPWELLCAARRGLEAVEIPAGASVARFEADGPIFRPVFA